MFNIHLVVIMTCFTRNILLKNCELDCVVVGVIVVVIVVVVVDMIAVVVVDVIVVVIGYVIVVVVGVDISVANFVLFQTTRVRHKIVIIV